MVLNDVQQDALVELINIAYARAAGALSQITGYRIRLEVPKVSLHSLTEAFPVLDQTLSGEISAVSQVFTGTISGNALLVLDQAAATALCRLLIDEPTEFMEWPESHREVMTEVGNIVLNACLGVFGNLLHVRVNFSLPLLHLSDFHSVLQSITIGRASLSHTLMIRTRFHLREANLAGYLFIVVGVTSLDRLLAGVDDWVKRELNEGGTTDG